MHSAQAGILAAVTPSFQEMHRRRQSDAFVGRAPESLEFRKNLLAPLDDPGRRSIVAVYGQGGMGKSTFLQHCREIADAAGASTALTDESHRDILMVMEKVAEELDTPGFKEFSEAAARYRRRRQEIESRPDAPADLSRVAAAAVGQIGTKFARRIPLAGVAFDFVDDEQLGEQLGEVAAFILANTKKRDDAELLLDPVGILSPLFVKGLASNLKMTNVVLFFDTFEETSQFVQPWLFSLLLGEYGYFPHNLLISWAGRNPPDPNVWSEFDSLLSQIEMQPLGAEDVAAYLASKGLTDETRVKEIIEASQGIPLYLAVLAMGTPDDSSPSETLIDRILRTTPKDFRQAALVGGIPRVLNRDVALLLFGEQSCDSAFDWLIQMPFVRGTADGWRYHDIIRAEFLKYARKNSPDAWKQVHESLASYYSKHENAAVKAGEYSAARTFGIQARYHELCFDQRTGLTSSIAICLHFWSIDPAVARPWARILQSAGQDADSSAMRSWGDSWMEAIEQAAHGNHNAAIQVFATILGDDKLTEQWADALVARADLYRRQGRYDMALSDVKRAADLAPSDPYVYYQQARVHLDGGDGSTALVECEHAIDLLGEEEDRRHMVLLLLRIRILRVLFSPEVALGAVAELGVKDRSSVHFIRGELRRETGQFGLAVADFEQTIQLDSSRSHSAWKEIATAYLEDGDEEEAVQAIKRSLDVIPTCGHCWDMLAAVYSRTIPVEKMRDALLEASAGLDEERIRPYRAIGLLGVGASKDACIELEKAVLDDPMDPQRRLWLVEALEDAEKWDSARREIGECLKLRPHWPAALRKRAMMHFRDGDFSSAEEDWAVVVDARPGQAFSEDLASRGLGLSIMGVYDRAILLFDQVLEREQIPEVAYNRFVAYSALHEPEEARKEVAEVKKILASAETPLVHIYGLAGVEASCGDHAAALRYLSKAVELDAEMVRGWAVRDPAWRAVRDTGEFHRIIDKDAG